MVIGDEYIEELKKKLSELDDLVNEIVNTSIRVTRLSKIIIYSLIRNDYSNAEKHIDEIKKEVRKLQELQSKHKILQNKGYIGLQEYAEAMIFYNYLKFKKIPTHKDLDIDELSYLNGLADFVGELLRKVNEELLKDNINFAMEAKKVMEEIYMKMLYLELKNFELRKKVDYIAERINWLNEKIFYKTLRKDLSGK